MWYIYEQNGCIDYLKDTRPSENSIELERMIPMPNKEGFESVLRADFKSQRVWYDLVPLPPTLQQVKAAKIAEVVAYDKSAHVNSFVCSGITMWLDKATRTSLAYTIEVESAAGKDTIRFWYDSQPPISFDLPITTLKSMLSALELYAKATYDTTQNHKKNIYEFETADEVESYDPTTGYPEKLTFN